MTNETQIEVRAITDRIAEIRQMLAECSLDFDEIDELRDELDTLVDGLSETSPPTI